MGKSTGAEGHPRIGSSWLEEYRPRRLDPRTWAVVRPFVLGCAERLDLDESAHGVRVARVLAQLAAWALRERLPLDTEVVLDPDVVERFVAVGLVDDRSRATYRATLRRVGPLLTKRAPWEARPAAVARRQVAMPYRIEEVACLWADAFAQPTERKRRAARALLALGAGAGLDGRWVARVATGDVVMRDQLVTVRVGPPSERVVPVLADWQDEVLDLAATAAGEYLVGGHSTSRNRAGALAASLMVGNGSPRFSASRLRSTWLVTHLALGTRLPEFARAAGLEGVTVLSDLLAFVPALDDDAAVEMLRGTR
jgi:integrase